MKTHPTTNCKHETTEKRFVGYLFTEEMFAMFCTQCNQKLSNEQAG